MSYNLIKTAGAIIDQQDDPGFVWDTISHFWPDDLGQPSIGVSFIKNACVAHFNDGSYGYPIDTPENALASSMYFLYRGIHHMDKDDAIKIASDLSTFRDVHQVSIPREFVDFCFDELSGSKEEDVEHYADSNGNLPITTPEQVFESIKFFEKNASAWNVDERMEIALELREAADHYGMNIPIEIADYRFVSPHAKNALLLRSSSMEKIASGLEPEAKEFVKTYTDAIRTLAEDIDNVSRFDIHEPIKIASELEALDKAFGMDAEWGNLYPDPIKSIYEGITPFGIEKTASYHGVDFSPLNDILEGNVVSAIQESPDVIIPTLPMAQKQIVEEFIRTNVKK